MQEYYRALKIYGQYTNNGMFIVRMNSARFIFTSGVKCLKIANVQLETHETHILYTARSNKAIFII